MLITAALLGCKSVEPAPEDIDSLAHYFWDHYDDDEDASLSAGVVSLHAALDADSLSAVSQGSITGLSSEQLALVGKGDEDATQAYGVYISNLIHCSLEDTEWLTYTADQDELHEGTYTSYAREYTSDLDAYLAREESVLTWLTTYEVEGFGANYTAQLDGWLRYVPQVDDETTPYGPMLFARGALKDAAYFNDSDERGIFQDYQLEVYYERAPGETVHLYAIWREMVYLGDADFSSETVQGFVLDGLVGWDDDADAWCAGGR